MRDILFPLLVLACPLMMILMMRGHGHGRGHGKGADEHAHSCHDGSGDAHAPLMSERSTTGLRELRAEIDRMIEEREQAQREQSEDQIAAGRTELDRIDTQVGYYELDD